MNSRTGALRALAVLATTTLALSACGSSGSSSSGSGKSKSGGSSSSSSKSTQVKADGQLVLGDLLPQTGDLAFLGPPEFAGVKTAVTEINKEGGVLGKPVKEIKADSGDGTPDIAGDQVDKLLGQKVDTFIGAAASGVSLSVVGKITDAGAVEFSPANTSPALDSKKVDPHNLYFRTAPSDVLQGAVLANTMLQDGHNNVAILARQDSYGELLASQVAKGITSGGGKVAAKILYSADAQNFTAEVNKIAATKPDAIAVIGFNETTKIIPTMIAKGIGPKKQQVYFVDGNTADYSHDLPPGTLNSVKATYPGAQLTGDFRKRMLATNPKLTEFTYGPESYDATMLTALAAEAAKSDSPSKFAPWIVKVSQGGTKCTTFKQCSQLLKKGKDIDYDGVSGPADLGQNGSPTKATIGIFQYGPKNTYHNIKYVNGVI